MRFTPLCSRSSVASIRRDSVLVLWSHASCLWVLPTILSRVLKNTSNGCNPRVGTVLSTPTTPSIGTEVPASTENTWSLLGLQVPRVPFLSFHVEVVWVCDVRSLFQGETELNANVHTSHSSFHQGRTVTPRVCAHLKKCRSAHRLWTFKTRKIPIFVLVSNLRVATWHSHENSIGFRRCKAVLVRSFGLHYTMFVIPRSHCAKQHSLARQVRQQALPCNKPHDYLPSLTILCSLPRIAACRGVQLKAACLLSI